MKKTYTKIVVIFIIVLSFIYSDKPALGASCAAPSVTGDWNNDGKSEVGIYTNVSWNLDLNGNNILDGSAIDKYIPQFGLTGDAPVTGDWNNDGTTEIGVFRGNGSWYFDTNGNGRWEGSAIDKYIPQFGLTGDAPVTGDWNNDGTTEIGVFRGNGSWYFDTNGNGRWEGSAIDKYIPQFGLTGDAPVTGDWNNDGTTEIGVFRGNGSWYFDTNGNGRWEGSAIDKYIPQFGLTGDAPVTGDWNNDGTTEIGVFRGNGKWYLDINSNDLWDGAAIDIFAPDFGKGVNVCPIATPNLGPEISVGLWNSTKATVQATPFKITANKEYNIKNKSGAILAKVPTSSPSTRVTYDSNSNLKIYNSIGNILSNQEVSFDATDGNNTDLIFDVNRPASSYDRYRGKIKIRYTDSNNIWIINTLPMEHYVWGMGETTGTGPMEHTKLMTMTFRTYGYWYITYATKYLPYGFRIKSDSGNQIYRGYDWETTYPNIKKAAENTRGKIVTYKGDIALTPYSSWTDGRTRSFEERWGSKDYPWCKSVSDPYGKHPTMTTAQLEAGGNHMVGVSANGSVKLAGSSYNKTYDWILKYYYTGIDISSKY